MTAAAQSTTRLTGRPLTGLRLLWSSAAVAYTLLFFAGIGMELRQARQDASLYIEITLEAYYLALALFILWRRSDDWMAGLLSITFMTSLSIDNVQMVLGTSQLVLHLILLLNAVSSSLLLCLFYVFPDGRFTPKWTRWAAALVVAVQIWRVFFEQAYMDRGFALLGLLFFTAPASLIYRYYRASGTLQRQQIKWVVLGLAVTIPPVAVVLLSYSATGWFAEGRGETLGLFIWTAFLVIFPLSITISILRYRLWDIDLIIRKTLVYALLSALSALVYFGSVVLLQSASEAVIGRQSPVIIVLSTLLIAALFAPLRRRIQGFIDRRFFRQKYNAQQVLARFAQTARDEVSLEAVTLELTRAVQDTMQPESVTIWLNRHGGPS